MYDVIRCQYIVEWGVANVVMFSSGEVSAAFYRSIYTFSRIALERVRREHNQVCVQCGRSKS